MVFQLVLYYLFDFPCSLAKCMSSYSSWPCFLPWPRQHLGGLEGGLAGHDIRFREAASAGALAPTENEPTP